MESMLLRRDGGRVNDYKFPRPPFKHQEERFYLYRDRIAHAHLWEQRCGKSGVAIATAAWQYSRGQITGLLICAPNGVHLNWGKNEIPADMPAHVGCEPVTWVSSPNREQRRALEALCNGSTRRGLRCLIMNIEALRTERGRDFALQFMRNFRTNFTLDEGSIIKHVDSLQTQMMIGWYGGKRHRGCGNGLGEHAAYRRLLNGTLITQSPLDAFPQFAFLDDSILGTSYTTFKNRYAVVEMQGRMKWAVAKKLEEIAARLNTWPWGELVSADDEGVITAGQQPLESGPPINFTVRMAGRMTYALNWKCGRVEGSERMVFEPGQVYPVITGYRHLDELQVRLAPHSDRILKADCLDLPEKVYQKRYVELSKKQAQMYGELKAKCITECRGREMSAALAIVKMLRLQQIVGGFYVPDYSAPDDRMEMCIQENNYEPLTRQLDRCALPIEDKNPRVDALLEDITEGRLQGKGVVWARFVPEIRLIAQALRKAYGKEAVAELYGEVDPRVRQESIDRFQTTEMPRFIVANPACKGVSRGQNLCKADWEVYYSNSFSLEDRLQSEDRPHSPGQNEHLLVMDFVAPGTLDEKVIDALRTKKNLADQVTGDRLVEWI